MDKKYVDFATGEKVTLEEWNRRNNARKSGQAKTSYSFTEQPKKDYSPLQGIKAPVQNTIQPTFKPSVQPTVQPIAPQTIQPIYSPVSVNPQNTPIQTSKYRFAVDGEQKFQKSGVIPNNPLLKNTYADRGLDSSKPIAVNPKKYIDEVTGDRVTLDEYNKRKSDPTYYKQELKKTNSLKNSFDISNYKDRADRFNRLDNAIKKIELNETAKKTKNYFDNLKTERKELERVIQRDDFTKFATIGMEKKENAIQRMSTDNLDTRTGIDYLNDKERRVFNYYFGKYGVKEAYNYLDKIMPELNQRMTQDKIQKDYKFGQEHEVLSFPLHAARSLMSGVGALSEVGNQVLQNKRTGKFKPIDVNSPAMLEQNKQDALAAGIVADNGPIGSFLTQVGLSMVDMAAALPFGQTGSLAILSSNAAGSAALNAAQRGATPEKALAVGIVAGAVEYATEKIGIDNLFRLAGKPTKSITRAIFSQMGAEGLEEPISQYANFISDNKIMGENSEYNLYIKELERVGFTREQAERDAKKKFLIQDPLMSLLGGVISGGVFGASGATYGRVNTGNTLLQDTNAALRVGTQAGGQAAETSARIQQNILDGKKPSAWEMGGLAADINETASAPKVTVGKGITIDTETKTFLENVAKKTGINIEVAEIVSKDGKQMSSAEGYYDRSQNKMVFAPDTSKANIIKGVVMHELTHSIEGSKFYEEYSDFAINTKYKNQQEFENEIQAKIQQYAKQGIELKTVDAQKEIVAELTRNTIFDEASINKLVAEKPNIAVQVYQSIVKAIDTAKAYLTGDTETLELEKARKLFEKALNERGVNTGTDTPQMSIKDNSFEQKFITDDSGKTHIRNVDLISDSDWNKIAKGFRQLGYDIRGTDDTKRVFSRYDKASFNDDQVTKLRQIFGGESEQTDNQLNKERAAKAARHFGTTTDFKEAGYILHNGNMLDFSGKKDGGPRGQRAMDHREISPVFDDETGDGYSEYMIRFMSEGNIRMSAGTGVDIGPIEPTQKQYATLRRFIDYQISKNSFFALDLSSEKGHTLESREYDEGTSASKIINDIRMYFKTGELPAVSDVQKFRYSIKDNASTAGATTETIEDAKREWKEKGTDSKYFKRWFGDSKAVDKDGKPLVVYHGTADEFTIFDNKEGGRNTDARSAKKAFFFSNDQKIAEGYAKIARPKYLDELRKRAERLDNTAAFSAIKRYWEQAEQAMQEYENAELEYNSQGKVISSYLYISNPLTVDFKGEEYREQTYNDILRAAIKEGHDGVIFKNTFDAADTSYDVVNDVYAVFSPTQIKSATDNIGTFDGDNADIRYSIKDSEGNTLTKEQSDHFKDSKERDKDGNIKVMYHGSSESFTIFDKGKAKYSGTFGKGFYFTDSPSHATTYGNLYKVYLNIKNPVDTNVKVDGKQLKNFLNAVAENEDYSIENYGTYDVDKIYKNVNKANLFSALRDINATAIGDMVEAVKLYNEVNGTNYDGIITDTETVVFEPNQIKRVDNKVPTENPDIRYSVKDNEQNTKRSEFYDDTKPIVKAVVNDLLKTYDSEYDSNKLENEVSDLYKKMQTSLVDGTGEYTEEELGNMAKDIAAKILENMRLYEGVLLDEEKDLLKHLRKSRISIDSVNKSDLADDYNTFRKRYMGNLLLVKNGLPVDSFYKELASLYPQYFNEEEHSNPGDQLQHIADVIDEIKSRLPVNDYKDDKKEIGNIVREMLKGYFKILTMPKTTEQKSKVDTAKIKHKISQFYENTIKRAKDMPQEVKDKLNPESFDFIPESSKEWQRQAEKNVNADMDGVIERLKNAPSISGGIEGHEAAIVAQRLVNKFKKSGSEEDFKEMQDFLKLVATKTRESARALKATDTAWDKTDPAAAVIRAERTVQKVIEDEKRRNPKKFADAESEKKQLQTKMKNAEKLAQKDKAQKKLSDEQTKKIEDKRKKQMLERWVRDTVPRAKQKNMLEKIQEMYEAGAYNDEALAQLVSEKRDIPYLSLDEVKKVIGYMDKANKLKEGSYEQRMAFSRAEQIIESKLPVTTRDKIKAFPRISILTGTRTQARNVVGNVIHGTYEAARENTVGLLVDVITSKFTGERKLTGNAIGKTSAYMKGFNMGVSEWYKDIKNKVDTSPTRTRGEVKRNSRTFKSAFLNAIDSVVKKGLSLGDRPFYQGAYEARLYELGKLNEKAKTKMSIDEMVLEAQAYALDKVYQNDSTVKKVATRLRNVSTAIDNPFWQGVAEVGMTMTVPFTETPANIFDKVLENSPIGITKAAIELGKTKNGTFDQMKFVQSLSRGLTGTGLMAAGAMLFAKGLIAIVPYDEEYDKYRFLQSIGVQNYALKVGDKYYSLSWVEPIATPILIGAEILRGSDDGKNIIENIYGTTKIAIDSFFEASFVQGIKEVFSSRSIGEGISNKLLDAHSMFTPLSAFGKALTQWVDPYVRETKDNSPLMQMLKERVAETPFLSKTLPTRIDVFGNEIKTLDGENHVFNVFFNPANVTDYVTTEVHDEIIKMYDTTEDINVFPDYINKPEIKYDGNAVTLDEKGFEKHKKEIGRALYDEYEKLFKTDTYKSMTAGEKVKAIRDAKADIKNQANFKAIKSSGDFLSGLTQNKQLYYDKTDLKLEADYLERWEELTPQDNKTVRDARLYDAVSDAVKAFDKSGSLSKDNMAKIKQYAENKRKREPTMMDLQLIAVYKATGEASVFNTNYQGLLEFTDEKVPRIINYPKTLLPELLAKSDSAVLEAYSKVMLSNGWLKMTSVQRFNALKKAKDKARKAFKEDLKNKYGAKIDTTNKKWQAMTPQEKAAAANKGYKIN